MPEGKQTIHNVPQQVYGEYPYNLLTAIAGQTDLVPPESMTADRCLGLQYALATLEEREQAVIRRRYEDNQSRSEIGRALGISIERIRQIESNSELVIYEEVIMSVVKVENLTRIFKQGPDEIYAVDNVSFSIEKGEFVAIVGQSGSGKTTLLNLLGGVDKPTSGSICIDGVDLIDIDDKQFAELRRRSIGYIFQDFNLIPILTAEENIIMPLLLDGRKAKPGEVERITSFLGIDNRLNHLPSELSGGQKQRIAIARALIIKPTIILADEPTGNLDKKAADEIMKLLVDINQAGNTVLLVTHEEKYANMCQRKIVISDGSIVQDSRINLKI